MEILKINEPIKVRLDNVKILIKVCQSKKTIQKGFKMDLKKAINDEFITGFVKDY